MLLGISDITYIISINIYVPLIDVNSRPATNINISLIDNKNNYNNCERDQKDCILVVNYQEIIKKSINFFSVNNIYKYIRSINF